MKFFQKISSILFLGSTFFIYNISAQEENNNNDDSSLTSVEDQDETTEDALPDEVSEEKAETAEPSSSSEPVAPTALSSAAAPANQAKEETPPAIPPIAGDKQSQTEAQPTIPAASTTVTATKQEAPIANNTPPQETSLQTTPQPTTDSVSNVQEIKKPSESLPQATFVSEIPTPAVQFPTSSPTPVLPLPSTPSIASSPVETPQELIKNAHELLKTEFTGPFTNTSIDQALMQLTPLITSRSVEKAVDKFRNIYPDKALQILETLIQRSRIDFSKKHTGRPFEVRRSDLIQIIFGVASQYRNSTVYNQFFDLISRYPGLYHGMRPLLFIDSISSYPVLIPDVIRWLASKGETNSVSETSFYAIDRTSTRSIKALHTYVPEALAPLLGSLLLYAISTNKPSKMITTLIDAGAAVNYADSSGYTPLIKAVEMGNIPITQLLVEHGANADLSIKDDVGSAWQKSTQLHDSTIMDYLAARYQKRKP